MAKEILVASPIRPILWFGLHQDGPGRPVEYDPEWDLRALMLRQLEQIPYVKDLVKRLSRNRYLRRVCGYKGKAPTEAHFSQMKKRIGKPGFIGIESYLRKEANRPRFQHPLLAAGLIQAACLDGMDLPAWSSRETSANRNEKETVEQLLEDVLGEDFEVELAAGDSQLESRRVFHMLEQRKIEHLIPWRRLMGRMNPPDVLTVKDRIQVEGPEHKRVVFGRLRAGVEGFISTLKNHLAYRQFTWKGLENASIHTSLAFCVVYAVYIAALKLGRPDLTGSISYFA